MAGGAETRLQDPQEVVVLGLDRSHAMAGRDEAVRAARRKVLEAHGNDVVWIVTSRSIQEGRDAPLGAALGPRRLERLAVRAQGVDAQHRYVITDAGPEETMRLGGWTVVRP